MKPNLGLLQPTRNPKPPDTFSLICNADIPYCYVKNTWHVWPDPVLHLLVENFNNLFGAPLAIL